MSLYGSRVIRGPYWKGGDEDGGEGHLGTVTAGACADPNTQVEVQWDNGNMSVYSIGDITEPELLLYDNGPAGVQHALIKCKSCGTDGIAGLRWQCLDCDKLMVNLCSSCYMGDKHSLKHQFECFSQPGADKHGIKVGCRKDTEKGNIFGISLCACVKTVGGEYENGSVIDVMPKFEDTFRSAVEVEFPNGQRGPYLLGHHGKVQVQLQGDESIELELTYLSHLPPLIPPERPKFQRGDKVEVTGNQGRLKYLQQNLDLWQEGTTGFCGRRGCVTEMKEKDGLTYPMVFIDGYDCLMNPFCLEKVNPNVNSYNQMPPSSRQVQDVTKFRDKQLLNLAKEIPADRLSWLAVNLGISDAKLSHIIADHQSTEQRIYKVLLHWRNQLSIDSQQGALSHLRALVFDIMPGHAADERDSECILEEHNYLGGGRFGEVYKVTWKKSNQQSITAAAKKIRITEDNSHKDILREVDMLKKLNHVNVIKFYGVKITAFHVIIVTDYAAKGSLRGILKQSREQSRQLPKRLFDKWMLEAALGIQYAHHQNIVHCDVKSENFVVTGDDILKLCDLGVSRHLIKTATTSREAGTEFWQAPEVFKEQIRSPACDVYSYGVVVWELYTCDYPGKGFTVPGAYQYRVGTENYRPPIPGDCPTSVRNLIERCWLEEYKQRPHMDKVVTYIQEGHSSVEELC